MAIEVTFCMNVSRDRRLTEKEINAQFDTYRSELLANDQYYGAILISSPGQPDVVVDDEVWATVQNLCFLSTPDLIAGKSVSVPYFRYGSELSVNVEGNEVVISGEFVPIGRFALQELLPALYDCGLRYIQFLRRLGEYSSYYEPTIKYLEEQAEVALQALEAAGYGISYSDQTPSKT